MPAKNSAFIPDDRQRQAIEHVHGPMLVVAGAGTGKTTVLIKRIARLIREEGVRPEEILAVTYTENSAREMGERVRAELHGTDVSKLKTKTFHAYCNELLIRHGKGFDLLEDPDLWILLRRRIRELNLKYFVRAANVSQFLTDLLEFMRRCQDELVTPEKYADYIRRAGCGEVLVPRVSRSKDADTLTPEEALGRCQEISHVFTTAERMLREHNLGTFGQMITRTYDLLENDPQVLAQERRAARFILFDEFQDANFAQVKILQRIAGDERNVFAVGDPDQAIYRFRGASSAAFALFQHHFSGAKLVVLDKNRRSTTPILQSAFAVISKNPEVFSSRDSVLAYKRTVLISARDEEAQTEGKSLAANLVDLAFADKLVESGDVVATILEKKKQLRASWKDFAVLYRIHSHNDEIAKAFADKGIPFLIENLNAADTPEVRDLLACAGAIVSLRDSRSLFRVAAMSQFTVKPEDLRAGIRALPRDDPGPGVAAVLEKIPGGTAVLEAIKQAKEEIESAGANARAALQVIIRHFALSPDTPPVHTLLEFTSKWEEKPITQTGKLSEFMEYLDEFREAKGSIPVPSSKKDAITLLTAHGAKGLEFNNVFVLRAQSNSFPSNYREPLFEFPQGLRDSDSVGQGDDKTLHAEEERRLFYVAMTRARDSLTLYGLGRGKKDPTPSGYLRELATDRKLGMAIRVRPPRAFQTDIFAAAAMPLTRTEEWLGLPPAVNLAAKLSASAVAAYEKCPLQFKLEREWRLPTEPPGPLQYGASMHRVLKAYYDSVRFDRPMDEATLIELFRGDLVSAGFQDAYQFELYEKQGIQQLKDFLAANLRDGFPKILHTEEGFEISVGATTIVGRMDRIDDLGGGCVAITDYKTGKAQTQEDADESLQLSIYAIAAKAKWGYSVERLVLYNLVDNNSVASTRTSADLQKAQEKVAKVASDIAAGKFDPKLGMHCTWCPYRYLCPETEKRLFVK
jgi:DNA helicase-2/ATP-dependent DNA helicase PcrA